MKSGDKVICINDAYDDLLDWLARDIGVTLPQQGQVYVIREARACSFTGLAIVHLVGLQLPPHPDSGREIGFLETRFRLLDEMEAEAAASEARSTVGTL